MTSLYHSFPRSFVNRADVLERGLLVLESIVTRGLLFTPDDAVWAKAGEGQQAGDWRISQRRFCLTALQPHDLTRHAKTFGPFALEFSLRELIPIGAIPAFYLPVALHGTEAPGAALIRGLGHIAEIVAKLKTAEFKDISPRLLSGQSAEELDGTLKAVTNLFCQIAPPNAEDLLSYYREQEWRLISNFAHSGQPLTRELTDSDASAIAMINQEYFEETIQYHGEPCTRISACRIMSQYAGQSVARLIKRIMVPNAVVEKARQIVSASGHAVPIDAAGA